MSTDTAASDTAASTSARLRAGMLYGAGAFASWGLLPLYVKAVASVSPLEVLVHRAIWALALVLLVAVLSARGRLSLMASAWRAPGVARSVLASATVLSVNWFVFVWSVSNGHTVDASLGYFINPLFSIALGALVLGERLTRVQWIAVACAGGGVLWLTVGFGRVPWIGLVLAGSFGLYGLLRKTSGLGALDGLALETAVLAPIALGYAIWIAAHGTSRFVDGGAGIRLLLVLAGPLTALPLILFAAGARRIPLSLLGLLQYITPTLHLALGVLRWHEPFGARQLAGYALIWLGFLVATTESFRLAASATPAAD